MMAAQWIAAIGSLSAVVLLLILWFGSPIDRAVHRVNRNTDYRDIETGSYQHHLRKGTPEQYAPNTYFPFERWWRAQDRCWKMSAILRRPDNWEIERYVSVTHRHHNREVTQTVLSDGRYRSALEAYRDIAARLSLPIYPTKIDPDVANRKAYKFEGDDYVVFVWALSSVPKRRSPSKRPRIVTTTLQGSATDGAGADATRSGQPCQHETNGDEPCPRTIPAPATQRSATDGCSRDTNPQPHATPRTSPNK